MNEHSPQTQPSAYDHQRWLHEMKREDAQRAHDKEAEFFQEVNKATIEGGNLTLRTAVLINGGETGNVANCTLIITQLQ